MKLDTNSKETGLSQERSTVTLTVDEKTTVVSHDTQSALPELKSDMTYSEANEHLNALYKMRIQWECDQYRASCTQLYELLRECYRVATHSDIDDINSSLRRCIEDQCKNKMLKILKTTTIEGKIVRAVFESLHNRQRVSSYAIVIQAAKLEDVKVDGFVDWLELQGGVEEVRLKKANSTKKVKNRLKVAKYKPPSDEEIRRGQENWDALLGRLNESEEPVENDDLDQSSSASEQSDGVSEAHDDASFAMQKHQEISADDNCDTSVANDDKFVCEPIDNTAKQKTESISSQSNTANRDDELIVCIARRRGSEDVAEIVYALTDETVSRLVFALYTEARYGKSDELTKLTRDIKSQLAA